MARPRPATFDKKKIVAENRRARFEYFIEQTFEAGIALTGTEVKGLRESGAMIREAYAQVIDGEVFERIPFGKDYAGEASDVASCRDCAAARGQLHVPVCCLEQCPSCGGQAIGCDCVHDEDDKDGEVQE